MVTKAVNGLSSVNVTVTEITDISSQQPTSKGSLFNSALPAAEADWLSSNITISSDGIMRLTVQVSITGALRIAITRSSVTKALTLNGATALNASALYSFDIPVKSGDVFNVRYSTTTGTIDFCEVQFIKGGI